MESPHVDQSTVTTEPPHAAQPSGRNVEHHIGEATDKAMEQPHSEQPTVSTTEQATGASTGNQRTKALLEKLKGNIEAVKSSEEFKAYLRALSVFHQYSWCNCCLIAFQRPDACRVAGYKTWQRLGRQVKKGEHGISIFAPITVKKRSKENEEKDEQERDTITLFRVVHVFDVSQTEGQPLPEPVKLKLENTHGELLPKLIEFCEKHDIKVSFQNLANAEGVSQMGQVIVNESRNPTEKMVILIHEISHELIHKTSEIRHELTVEQKELEAEATSFCVCNNLGLPDTGSDRYLALYHKSYDIMLPPASIHAAAQEILKAMDPFDNPAIADIAA